LLWGEPGYRLVFGVARVGFSSARCCPSKLPQGLKPESFYGLYGKTETSWPDRKAKNNSLPEARIRFAGFNDTT
jgi:hypothetical protein